MRADRERLTDVLEAIERIRRHTRAGRSAFDADELVQVWVVRHLQIIGEAATKLPEELLRQHPEVPWRSVVGMRHVLVHGYFEVDLDLVWSVVENELSQLDHTVRVMSRELVVLCVSSSVCRIARRWGR
jgi:uncharacterized protein with HEPN domain